MTTEEPSRSSFTPTLGRNLADNDASLCAAAEVLCCHPNTVRHRLRRIEKYTGRSLSRPKDVAELCLAFEVHRRLM